MTAIWKNLVRTSQGIYPSRAGAKTTFGTVFELWLNISLQRNMISTVRKKLINLQGLPYMSPPKKIWWTLVQKRLRMIREHLPTPKFSHWQTLPALPYGRYMAWYQTTIRQAFSHRAISAVCQTDLLVNGSRSRSWPWKTTYQLWVGLASGSYVYSDSSIAGRVEACRWGVGAQARCAGSQFSLAVTEFSPWWERQSETRHNDGRWSTSA